MTNTQKINPALNRYQKDIRSQKYQAILEAAHAIFLAEGFGRAQMSSISERADVSTATLYKHFRSKEELFIAVLKNTYRTTDQNDAQQLGDDDAKSAISKLMKVFVHRHIERNSDILLHIARIEVSGATQIACNIFKEQSLSRHLKLCMLLQQLVERGDLCTHDISIGAYQIGGMINEMLIWPDYFGDKIRLATKTDDIIGHAVEAYLSRFVSNPHDRATTI